MPKVSILVPSYNAAHFLPISIESALSQTYQDFEILVIDDGSTDNTQEVVKSYVNKYPQKVHYIFQENQGLPYARNKGIEKSQGEYLALLDADDQWLPHRLADEVGILDADSSVGIVHANITNIDINNKVIGTPKREIQYLSGYIFENIFLRKADLACPTVLFRRSCCDELGVFDVKLTRLGCEDRELWLRISQKYKTVYIDKILANYRVSSQSMSKNHQKMLEARLYVIDKFCPSDDPGKQGLRNKALCRIYKDRGDEFLFQKDFINSRQEYEKAMRFDAWAIWPRINWIKAALTLR